LGLRTRRNGEQRGETRDYNRHLQFHSRHSTWLVIASEAKQSSATIELDCFVASLLAMTV
jgi:hypothetical protein